MSNEICVYCKKRKVGEWSDACDFCVRLSKRFGISVEEVGYLLEKSRKEKIPIEELIANKKETKLIIDKEAISTMIDDLVCDIEDLQFNPDKAGDVAFRVKEFIFELLEKLGVKYDVL